MPRFTVIKHDKVLNTAVVEPSPTLSREDDWADKTVSATLAEMTAKAAKDSPRKPRIVYVERAANPVLSACTIGAGYLVASILFEIAKAIV